MMAARYDTVHINSLFPFLLFVGDPCDSDDDGDGVADFRDNCRLVFNVDQKQTMSKCNPYCLSLLGRALASRMMRLSKRPSQLCSTERLTIDEIRYQHDNFTKSNTFGISLGDTSGDACVDDFDGDGVPDKEDVCPTNPKITKTGFLEYKTLIFDSSGSIQDKPFWKVNKKVNT